MTVEVKAVHIGLRSRLRVQLLRLFFKPLMARMAKASTSRIAAMQVRAAEGLGDTCCGLPVRYRVRLGRRFMPRDNLREMIVDLEAYLSSELGRGTTIELRWPREQDGVA